MRVESTIETATVEQRKALKKACADMEGMFMNMLLKSMRKTVTKADLFGSAREEEMFQEMMDAEVCSTASRTQSVGIADMLYRELAPRLAEGASKQGERTEEGRGILRRAQDDVVGMQDKMVGLDALVSGGRKP